MSRGLAGWIEARAMEHRAEVIDLRVRAERAWNDTLDLFEERQRIRSMRRQLAQLNRQSPEIAEPPCSFRNNALPKPSPATARKLVPGHHAILVDQARAGGFEWFPGIPVNLGSAEITGSFPAGARGGHEPYGRGPTLTPSKKTGYPIRH